jgi:hypothetical protein
MDARIATVHSRAMKTIALAACALMACQSAEPTTAPKPGATAAAAAPVPVPVMMTPGSPYAGDIQNICNALALSGADKDPGGRQVVVANWLASHVATKEGHDFLVEISPLQGLAKADRLDGEAHKVGLPGCALSAMWRVPGATVGG